MLEENAACFATIARDDELYLAYFMRLMAARRHFSAAIAFSGNSQYPRWKIKQVKGLGITITDSYG